MASNPVDEIATLTGESRREEETVSEYVDRVGEAADVDPEVVAGARNYVTGTLFGPDPPDGEDAFRAFCETASSLGEPSTGDGATADERSASDDERSTSDDERSASDDERPASDNERSTSADERPASDDERPASDDEQSTSDDAGDDEPATEDGRPDRTGEPGGTPVVERARRAVDGLPEPTRRQALGGTALLAGGVGASYLYAGAGRGPLAPSEGPASGVQPGRGRSLVVASGERVVLADERTVASVRWEPGGVLAWRDGAALTVGGEER